MDRARHYTLRLSCPDAVGIGARVAAFFADSLALGLDELRRRFAPVARGFDMDWQINDSAIRKRVLDRIRGSRRRITVQAPNPPCVNN